MQYIKIKIWNIIFSLLFISKLKHAEIHLKVAELQFCNWKEKVIFL